jgi:hypothetical protein
VTDIKAILLVPEEGDPHGLLREGPCGAMPPMMYEAWYAREGGTRQPLVRFWTTSEAVANSSRAVCGRQPHAKALVLAYQGKVVVEAMDRLGRAYMASDGRHSMYTLTTFTMADAEGVRDWSGELGRIVLLNEAGEEIER